MTGKRFRLQRSTLAVDPPIAGQRRGSALIPAGQIVHVTSERDGDQMVGVVWNDRPLQMFAVDLEERGDNGAVAGY